MTQITKNASTGSFSENEEAQAHNVQALCEALAGAVSGEGYATWTAATTLVVSDTRVHANSRIKCLTARTSAPVGFWYVSSVAEGTFTITSTETETAGTIVDYIVV